MRSGGGAPPPATLTTSKQERQGLSSNTIGILHSDISSEERVSAIRPMALSVAEVRIHLMSPKAAYTFDINQVILRAQGKNE